MSDLLSDDEIDTLTRNIRAKIEPILIQHDQRAARERQRVFAIAVEEERRKLEAAQAQEPMPEGLVRLKVCDFEAMGIKKKHIKKMAEEAAELGYIERSFRPDVARSKTTGKTTKTHIKAKLTDRGKAKLSEGGHLVCRTVVDGC